MVKFSFWSSILVLLVLVNFPQREAQLMVNFYSSTCPNVETIVRQSIANQISKTFFTIPSTVRLFFHDCMVDGCDGSVLIFSPNGGAERDAPDNLSLASFGFDTITAVKADVEAQCPGIVSCADILALAARDVVAFAGGPTYAVELGRLDGKRSQASRVTGNLPEPTQNLAQLNAIFAKNNLTQTDMIALAGCHTIGFSHCSRFAERLYSFPSNNGIDPTLDPNYAQQLMQSCPQNVDPNIVVLMDPATPNTFDNAYFQNLIQKKGLFTSDEVLFTNAASQPTVVNFAQDQGKFNRAFVTAMTKLGRLGLKTGTQGEIRRDCSTFNS